MIGWDIQPYRTLKPQRPVGFVVPTNHAINLKPPTLTMAGWDNQPYRTLKPQRPVGFVLRTNHAVNLKPPTLTMAGWDNRPYRTLKPQRPVGFVLRTNHAVNSNLLFFPASFSFFRGFILMDLIYHHRVQLDHSPPSWDEHPEWFITICCAERGTNQLCHPEISHTLLDSARFYHQQHRWFAELFLLMPDHIHALISVSQTLRLDQVVLLWKRWTARHLKISWQTGFFERRLRSYESANEKYRYILNNPVRAGFVSRPELWPHKFIGTRFDQFAWQDSSSIQCRQLGRVRPPDEPCSQF